MVVGFLLHAGDMRGIEQRDEHVGHLHRPCSSTNSATLALTANSVADPTKWTTVSITVTDARPLQGGDYVFSFNGWQRNSSLPGRQAIVGRFHVDANGNITDGLEDINAD